MVCVFDLSVFLNGFMDWLDEFYITTDTKTE